MKFIVLILALATVAFAVDGNCTGSDLSITSTFSEEYDGISLRLLNNWVRPQKELLFGLDYVPGTPDKIIASNLFQQSADYYSTRTGEKLPGGFAFDIENDHGFGILSTLINGNKILITNDMSCTDLFMKVNSGNWLKYPNPISNLGRGMDYDRAQQNTWTTCGIKDTLVRYHNPATAQKMSAIGVPADASGLTLFSYGKKQGIAVTSYSVHKIFFYEITTSNDSVRLIGSAQCPVPYRILSSYGLTYNTSNNHFYWTYEKQKHEYYLAEFAFDLTSLDQSSWGSIKASF